MADPGKAREESGKRNDGGREADRKRAAGGETDRNGSAGRKTERNGSAGRKNGRSRSTGKNAGKELMKKRLAAGRMRKKEGIREIAGRESPEEPILQALTPSQKRQWKAYSPAQKRRILAQARRIAGRKAGTAIHPAWIEELENSRKMAESRNAAKSSPWQELFSDSTEVPYRNRGHPGHELFPDLSPGPYRGSGSTGNMAVRLVPQMDIRRRKMRMRCRPEGDSGSYTPAGMLAGGGGQGSRWKASGEANLISNGRYEGRTVPENVWSSRRKAEQYQKGIQGRIDSRFSETAHRGKESRFSESVHRGKESCFSESVQRGESCFPKKVQRGKESRFSEAAKRGKESRFSEAVQRRKESCFPEAVQGRKEGRYRRRIPDRAGNFSAGRRPDWRKSSAGFEAFRKNGGRAVSDSPAEIQRRIAGRYGTGQKRQHTGKYIENGYPDRSDFGLERRSVNTEDARAEGLFGAARINEYSAERIRAERTGTEGIVTEKSETERTGTERIETEKSETGRTGTERAGIERIGLERIRQERIREEKARAKSTLEKSIAAARRTEDGIIAERVREESVIGCSAEVERRRTEKAEAEKTEAEKFQMGKLEAEKRQVGKLETEKSQTGKPGSGNFVPAFELQESAGSAHSETVGREQEIFSQKKAGAALRNRRDLEKAEKRYRQAYLAELVRIIEKDSARNERIRQARMNGQISESISQLTGQTASEAFLTAAIPLRVSMSLMGKRFRQLLKRRALRAAAAFSGYAALAGTVLLIITLTVMLLAGILMAFISEEQSSRGSSLGYRIVAEAKKYIGLPYVYGGIDLETGCDCSGFVWAIYNRFGFTLPRTAGDQYRYGRKVSDDINDWQPGDLVYYSKTGEVQSGGGMDEHIVIYIGGGQVISCGPVEIFSWDACPGYYGTCRIIPDEEGEGDFLGGTDEEICWNYFLSQGFSPAAIAGIMGNMYVESGFDPTLFQYGGGPGRGLCQWEESFGGGSGRYNSLVSYADSLGLAWDDIRAQLQFVTYELDSGLMNPYFAKWGGVNAFKAMDDPALACYVFLCGYEYCGDLGEQAMEERFALSLRVDYANWAFENFQ